MLSVAPEIVNSGRSLLVRCLAGEALTFTCFKVGNGALAPGADREALTDLINPVKTFSISTMTTNDEEHSITLSGSFSNTSGSSSWKFTELGIFAEGEDGEEMLYAYAYDPTNGSSLPVSTQAVAVENDVEIVIAIGDAENVTAIVTRDSMYASKDDFDDHLEDYTNPHRVTAEQIGLGNVENVAVDDMRPTYTAKTGALQRLASGERLKDAMAKIALAISTLISHINNLNNPHRVSCTQVGAAPTNHNHAATDINSGVLPVERGGTGASTAKGALKALGAVSTTDYSVTVPRTGWSEVEGPEGDYYRRAITVNGITSTDVPQVSLAIEPVDYTSNGQTVKAYALDSIHESQNAYSEIFCIETVDDGIVVYSEAVPETQITLNLRVIQ